MLVPLAAACRGESAAAATGRSLRLEGDGRTLVRATASASRCAADSTIAVVAVGAGWAAALAMRLPWPVDSDRVLTAAPLPSLMDAATVAARPVGDSVGPALVSARGTVIVEAGRTLTGRFDVIAPTLPGAPDSVHLTGRFDGVPVNDDLCPPESNRNRAPVPPA
jgi:hypothetical protein